MDRLKINFKILLTVFTFSFLFFPSLSKATNLYLMPQFQTVYQGDSFIVEVRIDTEGEEINALELGLTFPSNLLEVVDFSKGNSILQLFAEEPKIQQGEISFVGGIPKGFNGDGLLGKINFLAKEIGKAEVSFKEDSKVLYGQGLLASLTFLDGNCEIIKKSEEIPVITSESHPDQNKWYKDTLLQLHWDPKEGAEYSWILSKSPLDEPDEISDKPLPKEGIAFWMGAMEYDLKGEGDGIYYFSLRQKLLGKDWQKEVSRFRAMIDVTSPEEFKPEIGKASAVFEGKYFIAFSTIDKQTGIDYYEILEADKRGYQRGTIRKAEWKKGSSPYLLEDQSLRSVIKVKAVDKAGNERIEEIVPPYKVTWKDVLVIILILIGAGVIYWIIRKIKK